MLFLKLKQPLQTSKTVIHALDKFAPFNCFAKSFEYCDSEGHKLVAYQALIPGGVRPSAMVKALKEAAPHTEWILVYIDSEGYLHEVMPGTSV